MFFEKIVWFEVDKIKIIFFSGSRRLTRVASKGRWSNWTWAGKSLSSLWRTSTSFQSNIHKSSSAKTLHCWISSIGPVSVELSELNLWRKSWSSVMVLFLDQPRRCCFESDLVECWIWSAGVLWQKSTRLSNNSGLLQVATVIGTHPVFREGEMHVCENNCALTVEDEIQFWGLDDSLLQVFTCHAHTIYLHLNFHSVIYLLECYSNSVYIFSVQPCCMIKYYPQVVTAREDKKIEVLCALCSTRTHLRKEWGWWIDDEEKDVKRQIQRQAQ